MKHKLSIGSTGDSGPTKIFVHYGGTEDGGYIGWQIFRIRTGRKWFCQYQQHMHTDAPLKKHVHNRNQATFGRIT